MASVDGRLRRTMSLSLYGVAPYNDIDDDDEDDDHHHQQQELQTTPRVFNTNWDESVFLFCAASLGLALNLCVIVRIMIRSDIRKSIGGAFVIHSCLLDTVKCLFCFPFAVSLLLDQEPSHCTLLGGAFVLVVTASGFNIVAMVCCEAYRFSERDFTAIRGTLEDEGVLKSENSLPMEDKDSHLPRCYSQELAPNSYSSDAGETSSTPTRGYRGYARFDHNLPTLGHSRGEPLDANCRQQRSRNWFQSSEPNLCEFSGIEDDEIFQPRLTFGSQPQVVGRDHPPSIDDVHRCGSDGNLRSVGRFETPQLRRRSDAREEDLSSSSPLRQSQKENSFACVLFGVVMVYVGSLIVHLGPTIIGGDFNYNDPIGNCLFAYGNVKSYVVQAMWIVIMSLAMLGAIFYLIRFNRHVKSKTGRRLAALVRNSVALSRGRLRNQGEHSGQSLELRRISLGRVRVLCLLTTVFVACWYPLYVLTLADPKFQRSVKLYKLLTFVAWSNSSINPLVIILFDRDVGISSCSCRVSRSCKCPCESRQEAQRNSLLKFPQRSSLVPLSAATQSQASSNDPEPSLTQASTPLAMDRTTILDFSQPVLTPSRSEELSNRLDSKTRSQLQALASQRHSGQGRDLYSKVEKSNRLSLLGRPNKKLSKQDLIHLRRIGSRLGTADNIPPNFRQFSTTRPVPPHPAPPSSHQLLLHHHPQYDDRSRRHHPHHHHHQQQQQQQQHHFHDHHHHRRMRENQRHFFYSYNCEELSPNML